MSPAIFQSSWVQPNLSLTPNRSMVSHSNSENEWDPPWPPPPGCSTTRVFCPSAKQNGAWSLAPLGSVSPGQFPAACRALPPDLGPGGCWPGRSAHHVPPRAQLPHPALQASALRNHGGCAHLCAAHQALVNPHWMGCLSSKWPH